MPRQHSTAGPLAAAYLLLVVYASLYPFEGWRWPAGQATADLAALPWPPWRSRFDEWANFVGYVPLGALLFASVARNGGGMLRAAVVGAVAPALMSYGMEVTQNFMPSRYPSLRDWVLNAAGGAGGAAIAALLQALGFYDRWQRVRERWFVPDSGAAIALMLLWPVGLLFPAPVPMGLGQVFDELRGLAETALAGTPWAQDVATWFDAATDLREPLSPAREGFAIALGLLAPCMLAAAVTRPGWRRVIMAPGAACVALGAMTLSSALNFGPDHALAWLTPATLPAIAVGTVLAVVVAPAPPRLGAALGLVVLTALVTIVAAAPSDPYYAASLQGWEQGRFIRFHGIAQWVGWLWPYAALGWLMGRLGRRA
jgi:VanZ family protein